MFSPISRLVLSVGFSIVCSTAFGSNIEIIKSLQKYEIHESAMVLSGDYLYFGEGKYQPDEPNKLFVYKYSTGQIVKTISFKHSIQYLAKTSNNGVVLTGKTSDPWLSYITYVTPKGDDFQVSSTKIRGQQLVEHIAIDSKGTLFFSDPGSRTIFKGTPNGLVIFVEGISNPGPLVIDGNNLFVIERNHIRSGDENVLKIDLETKQISSLYPRNEAVGAGITSLKYIDQKGLLAANQWGTNRVSIIDTAGMSLHKELYMDGMPDSLDVIGHCVVVSSTQSQKLNVVSYISDNSREFDFSAEPIRLKSVRKIQVSPFSNGADVFLRSTMVCDSNCGKQSYNTVAKLRLSKSDLGHCFE